MYFRNAFSESYDIITRGGRMNTILLGIVAALFLVVVVYLIPLLLELKKTVISVRNTTERNLNPALEELQLTLKSLRSISDNVNDITGDVKGVADSITEVSTKIFAVNRALDALGSAASVRVMSLKAGIAAASTYLLTNLMKKGDRK